MSQQRIAKGAVLYHAGTAAKVLYYVAEGKMRLMAGSGDATGTLKPNALIDTVHQGYIGEESILGSEDFQLSADDPKKW